MDIHKPMISNEEKILDSRKKRNEWFLKVFDVLSEEQKTTFQGLNFYPYDLTYLKSCDIDVFEGDERAIFAVEGYGQIELRKYGRIVIEIQNQNITLYLYCELEKKNPTECIAPFKDKTNGKTTYGGGRNLDIQIKDGKAIVDFNGATNLECAYTSESVCAMPLPENWLTVPIEAGEKIFSKE